MKKKTRTFAVAALLLVACTTTPAPKAQDVAVAAVAITDRALAAAIELDQSDAEANTAAWEARVSVLERAAAAVKTGQDVCEVLPDLARVADSIACKACSTAIETAKEQLKCQP